MSLEPAKQNLSVWRGSTFLKRISYFNDAAGTQPRDLTGYSAALTIRDGVGGVPLHTMDSTTTAIVLGGTGGTIDLTIAATVTAAFTWNAGVYSLTLTSPTSTVDTLLYGSFSVRGI